MDTQTLMIAGLAFIVIAGLGFAFAGGGNDGSASKRAKQIAATGRADGKTNDPAAIRRRQTQDMLRTLREGEQVKKKSLVPKDIGTRLKQAGLTIEEPTFWIGSAVLGGVLGVAVFILAPASITNTFLGEGARVLLGGPVGFAGFLRKYHL